MSTTSTCDVPNCEKCNEAGICVTCKNGFNLDGSTCYAACDKSKQCSNFQYCDLHTDTCKTCRNGCQSCTNATDCIVCLSDKVVNLSGQCEQKCNIASLNSGKTCKNGTVVDCDDNLTQYCQCSGAKNCFSCTADQSKCDTCLPGYEKTSGKCEKCTAGYYEFASACIPIQAPPNKCNSVSNTCIAGTFCPATDKNLVDCKKCDESIINGQGCNCKNDIQITNCLACQNGNCSKCIDDSFLKNNSCEACPTGCSSCLSSTVCQNFDDNLKICKQCQSKTICGFCKRPLIITIKGTCEPKCDRLANHQYCLNGVPTACAVGITSQCKCGYYQYCATCVADGSQCDICLEGYDLVNGSCYQCAEGYEIFNQLCLKINQEIPNCQTYDNRECSKCIEGYFISCNSCQACPKGCSSCDFSTVCTACSDNYSLIDKKCYQKCDQILDCDSPDYCDSKLNLCKECGEQCQQCYSKTICGFCQRPLITTIKGTCDPKCDKLTNHQYCLDGVPTDCAEGITSQCKCGNYQYCATCVADGNKCDKCLEGYKKVNDKCVHCADGYQFFINLCLKPDLENTHCQTYENGECSKCIESFFLSNKLCEVCPTGCSQCDSTTACSACSDNYSLIDQKCFKKSQGKLSGGAIAGIVIGVLVVVSAIAGGLGYHFLKKGKVNNVKTNGNIAIKQ